MVIKIYAYVKDKLFVLYTSNIFSSLRGWGGDEGEDKFNKK